MATNKNPDEVWELRLPARTGHFEAHVPPYTRILEVRPSKDDQISLVCRVPPAGSSDHFGYFRTCYHFVVSALPAVHAGDFIGTAGPLCVFFWGDAPPSSDNPTPYWDLIKTPLSPQDLLNMEHLHEQT